MPLLVQRAVVGPSHAAPGGGQKTAEAGSQTSPLPSNRRAGHHRVRTSAAAPSPLRAAPRSTPPPIPRDARAPLGVPGGAWPRPGARRPRARRLRRRRRGGPPPRCVPCRCSPAGRSPRPHRTGDLDARAVQAGDAGDAGDANGGAPGVERRWAVEAAVPRGSEAVFRGSEPAARVIARTPRGPASRKLRSCSRLPPVPSRPCSLRRASAAAGSTTPSGPRRQENARRTGPPLRSGRAGSCRGTSIRKTLPSPGALRTVMRPPCASTIRRARASPSPTPPVPRVRLRSVRKKGVKRRA